MHPYSDDGNIANHLNAFLRRLSDLHLKRTGAVCSQIVLPGHDMAKMVDKDEVGGKQFIQHRHIEFEHGRRALRGRARRGRRELDGG